MNIGTETLESMCELIVDCPHSTPKWTDEGTIVLRNQNIKNGVLDLSSASYTNEDDYKKRIKRAVPQAGDIVFTREAPMGEVCMIPEDLKCCLGQRQVLLRPKDDVYGEYLFWALQSPFVQHQISWNEGTGSTVSNVRIPVLKALNIPRHPEEEENIAKVLSDLAGKIELNRQTNQTLEQIAQTIFKSWFVDFEPVKAKIAAKQTLTPTLSQGERECIVELAAMCAISGKTEEQLKDLDEAALQQLKTTAALFPDALVESELGEIPEGWDISGIGDIVDVIDCLHSKKPSDVEEDTGRIYLQLNNISNEGLLNLEKKFFITEEDYTKWTSRIEVKEGDCIITNVGRVGAVSTIPKDVKAAIGRNITAVRLKAEYPYPAFLITLLSSNSMRREIVHHTDVGTILNALNVKNIPKLRFNNGGENVLGAFEKLVFPTLRQRQEHVAENMSLSHIRNALLPKLLSGEITIDGTQTVVDAVV